MNEKIKLKKINIIQGNFLTLTHFTKLNDIIKRENKETSFYLVIERREENEFSIWINDILWSKGKKITWASNTIWYWLIGFYILNIIDREISEEEMKKLNSLERLKIKINCNPIYEIFINENTTSSDISRYIYQHLNDENTFLNLLFNEVIGDDKNSFIYKLYYRYGYMDKLKYGLKSKDRLLDNFLNILVDGITGKVNNKNNVNNVNNVINEIDDLFKPKEFKSKSKKDIDILINEYDSHFKISEILRKNFRENLINHRRKNIENYIGNDLGLNLNGINDIDWYVEAAHIVPVATIVATIIDQIKEKLKGDNSLFYDGILYEELERYMSPKNGLLLPFNYHKMWDKGIFYFDINGEIKFENSNLNLLESFNINCKARLMIEIDNEMKNFINERNSISIKS